MKRPDILPYGLVRPDLITSGIHSGSRRSSLQRSDIGCIALSLAVGAVVAGIWVGLVRYRDIVNAQKYGLHPTPVPTPTRIAILNQGSQRWEAVNLISPQPFENR